MTAHPYLAEGVTDTPYPLGRIEVPDERDGLFTAADRLQVERTDRTHRYHRAGWRGDQNIVRDPDGEVRAKPWCVPFGGFHLLEMMHRAGIPDAWDMRWTYHECQKIDQWPGECVDYDTEVLTARGWLRGDELQVGDTLLGFDIETETTRWAEVEKVHRYPDAPYRVWSQCGFAAAVTDNHRWPVRLRPNGTQHPRPFRMTTTGDWRPGDEIIRAAPSSDQPTVAKWDDDLVEVVAWVMCEGHYRPSSRRGNGIVVSQKTHRDRVTALMTRLGVAAGHRKADGTHAWELSGELAQCVREIAPDRAPTTPWLASLTIRQLRLLLDVCVLADGNVRAQARRRDVASFSQKTGPILDAWLTACALAGQPVSRAKADGGSGADVETWTMRASNGVGVRKLTASEYRRGPVWCPQSELGTFVARRHGTVFITGNSYDGTSVRAFLALMKREGVISGYFWVGSGEEALDWIIDGDRPVIVGTKWTRDMFEPDDNGFLWPTGRVDGGHAWVANGGNRTRGEVEMTNSWGLGWGDQGRAKVTVPVLTELIQDRGEAAVVQLA